MKWSELRRIAEREGWILVRYGKKHDIYEKDGDTLYIERHSSSEIKSGLYYSALKILGIKK